MMIIMENMKKNKNRNSVVGINTPDSVFRNELIHIKSLTDSLPFDWNKITNTKKLLMYADILEWIIDNNIISSKPIRLTEEQKKILTNILQLTYKISPLSIQSEKNIQTTYDGSTLPKKKHDGMVKGGKGTEFIKTEEEESGDPHNTLTESAMMRMDYDYLISQLPLDERYMYLYLNDPKTKQPYLEENYDAHGLRMIHRRLLIRISWLKGFQKA